MTMIGETRNCYFQYGCGLSAPEGWLNFDASPTLWLQRLPVLGGIFRAKLKPFFPPAVRFGDIRRNFPLDENTAQGAYCSHVLEHLALEDCRASLRNTLKVLRPGGRFRLVMPDLRYCIDTYLASSSPTASHEFMRMTLLGEERRVRGLAGLLRSWLGHADHRWLWDYPAIESELKAAGFMGIRRATFNDSSDPRFAEVEDKSRWDESFGAECVKPE